MTVSLALVLAAVFGVTVSVNLLSQRRDQTSNLHASVLRLAEAVYVATKKPMSLGDYDSVSEVLHASVEGARGVRIDVFDRDLQIVYSSHEVAAGRPISEIDPSPALLGPAQDLFRTSRSQPIVIDRTGSQEYGIAVIRPVSNEPACHHCHASSRAVLGAILVNQSVEREEAQAAKLRLVNLTSSVAGGLMLLLLMVLLLYWMVLRPVAVLEQAANAVAEGDLSEHLTLDPIVTGARPSSAWGRLRRWWREDEVARLGSDFHAMTEQLRLLLARIARSAKAIGDHSATILSSAAAQASRASRQAAAAAETSSAVAELAQTAQQAGAQARQVLEVAGRSEDWGETGRRTVADAVKAIDGLVDQVQVIAGTIGEASQRTRQIAEIMHSVEEIARQSDVLALNTAIEAAHAGQQGRGFGIIAQEVRALAAQSEAAVAKVRELLKDMHQRMHTAVSTSEEGVEQARSVASLARGAGTTIAGLAGALQQSSASARTIAQQGAEQAGGVSQIASSMAEISTAAQETLWGAQSMQEVAGELTKVAGELNRAVERYSGSSGS
ncbi:MAG TPA: methyl-accepting chemotaxis protein [Anaeromyxobacter sp.]|nr:methyl-accepting chemotaxis protein [Anaeromyxobacter sp.]